MPGHWPAEYWLMHASPVLTHWGRDKMAAVSQMTHSNAFSLMKILEFRLRFHWSLFLRVQLVQIMAWRRSGDKPLSEPMMVSLLTHICVTRPQWVNNGRDTSPLILSDLTINFMFYFLCIPTHACWSQDSLKITLSEAVQFPFICHMHDSNEDGWW